MDNTPYTDDKLGAMLRHSTVEQPPTDFTDKLMLHIRTLPQQTPPVRITPVAQWLIISFLLLAGAAGVYLGLFYILEIDLYSNIKQVAAPIFASLEGVIGLFNIEGMRRFLILAFLVLLLLIGDMILRRHWYKKHQLHEAK